MFWVFFDVTNKLENYCTQQENENTQKYDQLLKKPDNRQSWILNYHFLSSLQSKNNNTFLTLDFLVANQNKKELKTQ